MSKANHTFYIDKRKERISLDGKWEFFSTKKKSVRAVSIPKKSIRQHCQSRFIIAFPKQGFCPIPISG